MNLLTATGLKYLSDRTTKISDNSMASREEILSRLKFLGYIQKDEKISTRFIEKQPNNIFTSISRSIIYPDNKNNSLKFVRDIISRTFEILELHIHDEKYDQARNIIADLLRAQKGILNMKYTYSDNIKFCCDIDIVNEEISENIKQLCEKYPKLKEE